VAVPAPAQCARPPAVVAAPPPPPTATPPLPPACPPPSTAFTTAGLATPLADREAAGLVGLIPPRVTSPAVEVARAAAAVADAVDAAAAARSPAANLAAFAAMTAARTTFGDAAFFGLLRSDPARYLPAVYTPCVADACAAWSRLAPRPPALYLSAADAGHLTDLVARWPPADPAAPPPALAVITDGARILGLGDLGAHGCGIPVGKCTLHAAAGGLGPARTVPVLLDVGCDTASVRDDPLYVGLPRPRLRGAAYDEFVDEARAALVSRFGPGLIIHYEDFAAGVADSLLKRSVACALPGAGAGAPLVPVCPPSFSDDIQATGAVALAALLGAAAHIPGVPPLTAGRFLFYGAGQAAVGTARAVVAALVEGGRLSTAEAVDRVWLLDSRGLVTRARPAGSLSALKAEFARPASDAALVPPGASLAAAVAAIQPTALIGAAAVPGSFTPDALAAMVPAAAACAASFGWAPPRGLAARPVILALSNPDTKAECSAVAADAATGGAAVFAAGTAQPPHPSSYASRRGSVVSPAFANNALCFPGAALGAAVAGATALADSTWLAAARAVAACVSPADAASERCLPDVGRLVEVTAAVAAAVAAERVAAGGVDVSRADPRLVRAAGADVGSGRVSARLAAAAAAAVRDAQYDPLVA
jgi:malate dehydrogenase (oxaloacetate-decarboxylating)(NADP+)